MIHKDDRLYERSSLRYYLIFAKIHHFLSGRKRKKNRSVLSSLLSLFSIPFSVLASRNNKLVVSTDIFLED